MICVNTKRLPLICVTALWVEPTLMILLAGKWRKSKGEEVFSHNSLEQSSKLGMPRKFAGARLSTKLGTNVFL